MLGKESRLTICSTKPAAIDETMKRYYDTGVLLKLYTLEPESDAVRAWIVSRGEPLPFTSLQFAECVSALRLKCFRGECEEAQSAAVILDLESDVAGGVLLPAFIDWAAAWEQCRILSDALAASTGCRTLDSLHLACAKQLGTREFITTDGRQAKLAKRAGFKVPSIL